MDITLLQGSPAAPVSQHMEQQSLGSTGKAKADDRLPAGAVGKSDSFEVASTIREQLRLSAISTVLSLRGQHTRALGWLFLLAP